VTHYEGEEKPEQNGTPAEDEQKPTQEITFSDVAYVPKRGAPVTAPLRPEDAPDIPSYTEAEPDHSAYVEAASGLPLYLTDTPVEDTPAELQDYTIQPRPSRSTGGKPVEGEDANEVEALPAVAPGAELSQPALHWGWKALVFVLTLGIYLSFLNKQIQYNSPPTGDQPFYLMVTMSLIQDGDLDIANQFANHDEDKFYAQAPHPPDFVGIPAPYPLPPHNGFANARPPTEQYNFHWPGLSALLIPAWIIGGWFQLWWPATIVFMIIVGSLTALNVFLFAFELTGKKWIAFAVWFPISFSNPVMSYTYLIFTELICGLLLLYALRRLALGWAANGPFRRVLIGLCIALIPWIAWRCMPLSVGLGIYAAVQWWRHYRIASEQKDPEPVQVTVGNTQYLRPSDIDTSDTRSLLSGTAWMIVPIALSGLLMAWHNTFLYGSLFPDNRTPERPFDKIFFWPWQGREDLTHFTTSIVGLLLDQKYGLLIYAPIYLLGILGLVFMFRSARRSDRRLLMWMGVVSLPYLFIIFSFYYWNGLWCPPARFLTTFCPLMAAPLAMSLFAARNLAYKILYGIMVIPGLLLMWPMLIDPRHMWPGNPVFDWIAGQETFGQPQLYPFKLDLRGILPFVDPLGARLLPPTTFWVTVIAVAIFVLGFVLARQWQSAQRTLGSQPLPYAMQGVVWVVGLSLVGGTWYYSNWDGLQHKTQLTEVGRWIASDGIDASRSLAFLDGKVYVPEWETARAGVIDTVTGVSSPLPVVDENGNNLLDHPSDFTLSPDGKLYLLNNSPNPDNALLVLSPEGKVERKITLNNKSQIAISLAFGPDGNMYVSDMTGRRIKVYKPDGGDPIAEYTGDRPEGFDNGAGIVVSADGTIYEAEISYKRINVLNNKGEYVKSFPMKCAPWYVLESGDWLDISCQDGGLFSINKASGDLQTVDINTGNFPKAPTGMVYAPDGTLYVIDRNTLIAYKVTH
jgi:hypothetical protein